MFFKMETPLEKFANAHYPDLALHPKMLEQLTWLQHNSVNTSQSNINAQQDHINIEVKRVLSRYNALRLLKQGGTLAYSEFVQSQPEDIILSEYNFNLLSAFIQLLTPAALECLIATCFITKSDVAITAVPEDRRNELPADSEQFITYMTTHFPKVFPICALQKQESINLLPYAFYKNSHARQMLDLEGGYNMVSEIAEAIGTIGARKITSEQYNLWFARWIINIAGLDGHINHKGSIYLTEPVANCIWALKFELDQLWFNPNHPVMDNYLVFRKNQLEVNDTYIAYLGALMRQYNPKMGLEIQSWFGNLSEKEQQEKIQVFKAQLEQTKMTPTYKPTVLVNLLQLGCSVSDTLTIFTDIECQAVQTYTAAIAEGFVSENTPLSYRNIADKKSLLPIKEYYERNHRIPELTIDAGGYLIITTDSLNNNLVKMDNSV